MNNELRELSQTELAMVAGGGELAYIPIAGPKAGIDLLGLGGGLAYNPIAGGPRSPLNFGPIGGSLPLPDPAQLIGGG